MSISVSEFIKDCEGEIKDMYGYRALIKDLGVVGNKRAFTISNDMLAKNLLCNNYGHVCDERLSHAFKRYVRANTQFEGVK